MIRLADDRVNASTDHLPFMQRALDLARAQLGRTWPNPSVGAVIVNEGRIIAEAVTARSGRPHAEPQVLAKAGEKARGATLYLSLEPCAHYGKTPPCTDAIITAGIAHVVIACRDPAPYVSGKGIEQLKAAGIHITEGICAAQARDINRGFFSVMEKGRPYIALKIATSADGKIAYEKERRGKKDIRWITGEAARYHAHILRSQYDAILTGIETVLADDPMLNVRIPGLEDRSPVRIILDRHHRLPEESKIARSRLSQQTWVLSSRTMEATLKTLAEKGITRVLVEAGKTLNTAFLQSGVVDRVYWFKAPFTIGEEGLDAAEGGLSLLAGWHAIEHSDFSPDTLDVLEPCLPASSPA